MELWRVQILDRSAFQQSIFYSNDVFQQVYVFMCALLAQRVKIVSDNRQISDKLLH